MSSKQIQSRSQRSFRDFNKSFSYLYQLFGVCPTYRVLSNGTLKLHITNKVFTVLLLVVYWTGMGFAFARKEYRNNTLSIVSNFIQLILNALAFSVSLVWPLWKYKDYHEIIRQFEKVDRQFNCIDLQTNYRKQMLVLLSATITFLLLMLYTSGFDFYVSVIRDRVTIAYWTLYSVPLFTYGASLHQAILMIFFIHKRLKIASKLLEFRILPLVGQKKKEKNSSSLQILDITICPCGESCNGRCLEIAHKESLSKVFPIINDIYLICGRLDDYFGPVFLSSLAALFTVTSIQCFYCFVMASDVSRNPHRIWNLIDSFNTIMVNVLLVIAICCVAEFVAKDVDRIMTSIIVDQQRHQVSGREVKGSIILTGVD